MGTLALHGTTSDSQFSQVTKQAFPSRPAFGSKGKKIVVFANYFPITIKKGLKVFKYTINVYKVPPPEEEDTSGKGKAKARPQNVEVKGQKLYMAVWAALKKLEAEDQLIASEFKSQVIFTIKPDLGNMEVEVDVPMTKVFEEGQRVDKCVVKFYGPQTVFIDDLLRYLETGRDTPGEEGQFPHYPIHVDTLNVVVGHQPRMNSDETAPLGSSRFFAIGENTVFQDLRGRHGGGNPLVALRGYFKSVRLGTGRLMLNVNVAHCVFKLGGNLAEIMDNLSISAPKAKDHNDRPIQLFARFLNKSRLRVSMQLDSGKKVHRPKTVYGFASRRDAIGMANGPKFAGPDRNFYPPGDVSFYMSKDGEGTYKTVKSYFKEKYKMDLGNYPLINVGSKGNPVYVPAEICEMIPGQPVKAKLSGPETEEMLRFACRSPYANALSISQDSRSVLGLDEGENLDKYGISVGKELLTVHARVLDQPGVRMTKNLVPKNGSWNMSGNEVHSSGTKIDRWAWLHIQWTRDSKGEEVLTEAVENFVGYLAKTMKVKINLNSVKVPGPRTIPRDAARSVALDKIFQWADLQKLQLLFFVLDDEDSTGLHPHIKTLGDCTWGIHTSCVNAKKFAKLDPSGALAFNAPYYANVGLKWNTKFGGINHALQHKSPLFKDGKTMVIGYDVTHPTNMNVEKGNEPPSLVGLVASIDDNLAQWPAVSWEQNAKQEMLSHRLEEAIKSRLVLWQKKNPKRGLPENILIYRDGVSEGQFAQVLSEELPQIRKACRFFYKTLPKMTIIVSVKRHQTRFFPSDKGQMQLKRDGSVANGNVPNGTIVDRGVTQVRYWDFFLVAHESIKGTARPAHYTVLLDEIFRDTFKNNPQAATDELEKVTHELCYLFARATRAVSICPPAYYADIVCERARAHRPQYSDTMSVLSGSASEASAGPGPQINDNLKDTMYYI